MEQLVKIKSFKSMSNILSAYEEVNQESKMQEEESFFISITYPSLNTVKNIKNCSNKSKISTNSSTCTRLMNKLRRNSQKIEKGHSPCRKVINWRAMSLIRRYQRSRKRLKSIRNLLKMIKNRRKLKWRKRNREKKVTKWLKSLCLPSTNYLQSKNNPKKNSSMTIIKFDTSRFS